MFSELSQCFYQEALMVFKCKFTFHVGPMNTRSAWFLVNYALRLIHDNGDSQNHRTVATAMTI